MILDGQCNRVVFLEDPHVARRHKADIQLLERAARTRTVSASCMSDQRNADRWLSLLSAGLRLFEPAAQGCSMMTPSSAS